MRLRGLYATFCSVSLGRPVTRRELAAGLGTTFVAAIGPAADARSTSGDIVVIGASGRTGMEVVKYCVSSGLAVRACSRTGVFTDKGLSSLVTPYCVDVSKPETLEPAIKGASVVIFAATAPALGSPAEVDHRGLEATSRACVLSAVPRLVVISGAGVTLTLALVCAL